LPITNSLKTRRNYNTRLICGKYVASSERKRFFFEKKKQKTFAPAGFGTTPPQPPVNESFLLLFFKKEALIYLARILGKNAVKNPITGKNAQTRYTNVTLVTSANCPSTAAPIPAAPKASPKNSPETMPVCPGINSCA
jgi:hypothetical protein